MNKNKLQIPNSKKPSESGYTILEGLMAILVVAALITMVGPVIAFSVGTRVQAKRVELATQAAKTYMNAIRANPYDKDSTTNTDFVDSIGTDSNPPSGTSLTCPNTNAYCTTPTGLYCVDFDNEPGCTNKSLSDMIVQPVRSAGDPNNGYKLGIRVYRANSFSQSIGNNLETTTPSTNVTNALGNRNAPLVTMTTDIPAETDRFRKFKD